MTMTAHWTRVIKDSTTYLNETYAREGKKVTLENFDAIESALLKVADDLANTSLNIMQLNRAMRDSDNDYGARTKYTSPFLNTFETLLQSVAAKVKELRETRARLVKTLAVCTDETTITVLDVSVGVKSYDMAMSQESALDWLKGVCSIEGLTAAHVTASIKDDDRMITERTSFNSVAVRNSIIVDIADGYLMFTDAEGDEHEVKI
jgi:hypothetical protein